MHSSYSALWFVQLALQLQCLPFSFLLNIYLSWKWHIYCYTNTTNFAIFSQLLRCQFLISRKKKMRLWPTVTENKCFMKMLQHLLCECVKATILFGSFNMYCSSLHWFFLVIGLCSFKKKKKLYELAYIYILLY